MIVYKGPSLLNGEPIVAILTIGSENVKTGDSAQLWILADNGNKPTDVVKSGADTSICGDCVHRRKSCYVNVGFAPNAIYAAYRRGKYKPVNLRTLRVGLLRYGAYGDPAAIPLRVLSALRRCASHTTGYTHQWRTCPASYAKYLMASCDTSNDVLDAMKLGYRTFRVKNANEPIRADEIVCPASEEAGKRLTCSACKACRGRGTGRNVVINVHGLPWKIQAYSRRISLSLT